MQKALLFLFIISLQLLPLCAQDSTLVSNDNQSFTTGSIKQFWRESESQRKEDSSLMATLQNKIAVSNDPIYLKGLKQQLATVLELDSLRKVRLYDKITSAKSIIRGSAVVPFYDTLFTYYIRLGAFLPNERAERTTKRIYQLYELGNFHPDSIRVLNQDFSSDVFYNDHIIVSVTDNDALWECKDRKEVARDYAVLISKAVSKYRADNSFLNQSIRVGLVLLILLVLLLFYKLLKRLTNKISAKVAGAREKYLLGFSIRDYELLSADHQLLYAQKLINIASFILYVSIVYISLPIMFSIFPFTEGIAKTLINWVVSPATMIGRAFIHYLPNFITIFIIFFVTRFFVRLFKYFSKEIELGKLKIDGFYPQWAKATYQIISVILWSFAFIMSFPYLPGSNSPIFQGVGVFFGVLFSLGSTNYIANIVAGFVITFMRPFQLGDRIKIGEQVGDVVEKSLLVTRIKTVKNEEVIIPNSTILSSQVVNYTALSEDQGLIIHTTITIGYDVPWREMHKALLTAADRTELILKTPIPFVLQTGLEDFYVSYQINGTINQPSKSAIIYSDLHQNIQDVCNEMGIEIMSPHYRAQRDGNTTTIPANYLDKDYKTPSFGVKMER